MSLFEIGKKGIDGLASLGEIKRNAAMTKRGSSDSLSAEAIMPAKTDDWMTEWSDEEELLTDNVDLQAPWERVSRGPLIWILGLLIAIVGYCLFRDRIHEVLKQPVGKLSSMSPLDVHAHLI